MYFEKFIIHLCSIVAYDGSFSWRNYLTEKNQEPVPFECFNYVRSEQRTRNDYLLT